MLNWVFLEWQHWVHQLTPHLVTAKVLLQFALIFACVTWIYFKIQGTYVSQLLKSVTVIMGLYLVSSAFGLTIISSILEAVLMISIIGFIVLFQPELRRLFVTLGQPISSAVKRVDPFGGKNTMPNTWCMISWIPLDCSVKPKRVG